MQPTTVLDATVSSEKITTSEINEVVIRYYLDTRYFVNKICGAGVDMKI